MKPKHSALTVLAGAFLLLGSCAAQPATPQPLTVLPQDDYSAQIYGEDGSSLGVDIRLQHLSFSGAETAAPINEKYRDQQAARLSVYETQAGLQFALAEQDGSWNPATPYYTRTENVRVACNDGQTLSLVTEAYEYTQNAAHPMNYRYGSTYDATNGTALRLEDYWGEDAVAQIAATIYSQLEEAGRLDAFFPNLAENLQNTLGPDDWCTDGQQLYILYDPYEIAAYAAGIWEFPLPLTPEAPAAATVKP